MYAKRGRQKNVVKNWQIIPQRHDVRLSTSTTLGSLLLYIHAFFFYVMTLPIYISAFVEIGKPLLHCRFQMAWINVQLS